MANLIFFLILTLLGYGSSARIFELDLVPETRSADKYSELLQNIREDVRDPKLRYGGTSLPVIGAPTDTYIRVNLLLSVGIVSLGFSRNDLYLLLYKAKNERGIEIAYYFPQVTLTQVKDVFPEVLPENYCQLPVKNEQYGKLEKNARNDRRNIGLGINKLVQTTEKVHAKARDITIEASFLLVALQMIAEASRFRYIESEVIDHFLYGFRLDDKVLILEWNWATITYIIKDLSDGILAEAFTLSCKVCTTPWKVHAIGELKIGILKFCMEGEGLDGSVKKEKTSVEKRDDFNEELSKNSRGQHTARNYHTLRILPGNDRAGTSGRNDGRKLREISNQYITFLNSSSTTVKRDAVIFAVLFVILVAAHNARQRRTGRKNAHRRLLPVASGTSRLGFKPTEFSESTG